MSDWMYQGEPFEPDEELLKEYVGFVYLITEKETGKKYVGKKLFWNSKILPVTKKRKRRQRTKVESNWRDYFGSNKMLLERVESCGATEYDREILRLCKTKGECSYYETKEQFDREVLFSDEYYNGIINCRISSKHLGL